MKLSEVGKALAEAGGSEIAEAALVLPIMFLILLGIYYFGLALSTYETINHAAMEAARMAAMATCATCARGVNTTVAGGAAQQVLQTAGLNQPTTPIPGETVPLCNGAGPAPCNNPNPPNMCVYYQVALNTSGPQACGVYVSFQYPYTFNIPFTGLNQGVELKARVQVKGEY
jgi:Flp pilus assembly protein TadG